LTRFDALRWTIFAAALTPAAALVYWLFTGNLTANPIDYITDTTGTTALVLLVSSLTITPLRRLTGVNQLITLRRMLGLFAFFYACLHVSTWMILDWFFDFASMASDVVERPFITMGMTTFVLLVPLALTSSAGMIRRLGRRWTQLHRLVYVAAMTAIVHFWWVVKADFREPRWFALAVTILLAFRIWWTWRPRLGISIKEGKLR
jgi:sulfoxide reductase heme-binding subunit YedZ